MIETSDFKRGVLIELDNSPCVIEEVEVKSPSARGAATFYKIRSRNIITGQKVDKSFRSGDTVSEPNFEKRDIQYLFKDGSHCHFMDLEDYSQFSLALDLIQDKMGFIIDGLKGIRALVFNDEIVGVELPDTVELLITECDPSVRGNSASPRPKKAVLETGIEIQVPEHIASDEKIKVDTRTGKFLGRVN